MIDPLIFLARKSKNPEVQFRVASSLNNLAANEDYKEVKIVEFYNCPTGCVKLACIR